MQWFLKRLVVAKMWVIEYKDKNSPPKCSDEN